MTNNTQQSPAEPTCDDVIRSFEEQVRGIVADDVSHHRSYERQLQDIRQWAGNIDLRYEPADAGLSGADQVTNELQHIHLALVAQKAQICASY